MLHPVGPGDHPLLRVSFPSGQGDFARHGGEGASGQALDHGVGEGAKGSATCGHSGRPARGSDSVAKSGDAVPGAAT